MSAPLPPLHEYAECRRSFLAAADARGAGLDHHRHPLAGPNGEPVFTDVARLGPAPGEAEAVVVIASGTHGVEGHLGWGLQQLLLADARIAHLPAGVAVVLVHAVNPFGMAWSRRVDHDNIDVNRNFVDFSGADLPANGHYAEVDHILNPVDFDIDDLSWKPEIAAFSERVGPMVSFRTLSGGQFDHPAGMQFGGQSESWSRQTLAAIWSRHLRDAPLVVNLDLHSGLGRCAKLTVFQTADEHDASADLAAGWLPKVQRYDRPERTEPLQAGVLGPSFDASMHPSQVSVPLVLEFGTHSVSTVFGAMRADNWLHNHGDPRSALGDQIRAMTRDAFFIEDEGWRTTVADDGMRSVHAVLDGVVAAMT